MDDNDIALHRYRAMAFGLGAEGDLSAKQLRSLVAVIEAARARDTGLTLSCIEHADNCCHKWCVACQNGLKADSALLYALEALDSEEE